MSEGKLKYCEIEHKSLLETIDFLTAQTRRQGRLIARIADTITEYGDPESKLDMHILELAKESLKGEVELMRKRIAEIEGRTN